MAGEISGASSMILEHAPFGRRGLYSSFSLQGVQAGQILAAAVFIPLARFMPRAEFLAWGWRIPFLFSLLAVAAGYVIRRRVAETPVFAGERARGPAPRAPVVEALTGSGADMVRVTCMALMNVIPVVTTIFGAAYAIQPRYGVGLADDVYLWIPVLGNCVAVLVIPFVGQLSDRVGRRPPIIAGSLAAGVLSFAYLHAISIRNVPLAIVTSVVMWGVVYQGYNAVFPSFYPELFPARIRVTAMAIAQNLGTTITALLPAVFAAVAPPGSTNVPVTVGAITLAVTAVAATAAWTTRETYRIRLDDLGSRPPCRSTGMNTSACAPRRPRRDDSRHHGARRPHRLPDGLVRVAADLQPLLRAGRHRCGAGADGMPSRAFSGCLAAVFRLTNIRGALITMPHKVTTVALLDEASPAVRIAGSCNAVRRAATAGWRAICSMARASCGRCARKGCRLEGARALVAGAGGVGSAIIASLAAAGAASIAVCDPRAGRRTGPGRAHRRVTTRTSSWRPGASDPAACDIVVNATPLGMAEGDPMPIDVARIAPGAFVGDVVMTGGTTPFLAAAQARGCRVQPGIDMLFEQIPLYLEFFGFPTTTPEHLREIAKRAL